MRNIPRILPLVGIAAAGVLAVNAMAGARSLPDMISGAKAFAEEASKPLKGAKGDKVPEEKAGEGKAPVEGAAIGSALDASTLSPAPKPPAVCAPTAAELAKEAGLSPAELQILQSLGSRRGQLDQREQDMDVQLALLAAAEAKLDAKLKTLTGLKGDVQSLLNQADGKEQAEVDRLVKVFEGMKAKDAAPRLAALDDGVLVDAADEPGVLPLLQETMRLLWPRMRARTLTLDAYQQIGAGQPGAASGLAVAIGPKADATPAGLDGAGPGNRTSPGPDRSHSPGSGRSRP